MTAEPPTPSRSPLTPDPSPDRAVPLPPASGGSARAGDATGAGQQRAAFVVSGVGESALAEAFDDADGDGGAAVERAHSLAPEGQRLLERLRADRAAIRVMAEDDESSIVALLPDDFAARVLAAAGDFSGRATARDESTAAPDDPPAPLVFVRRPRPSVAGALRLLASGHALRAAAAIAVVAGTTFLLAEWLGDREPAGPAREQFARGDGAAGQSDPTRSGTSPSGNPPGPASTTSDREGSAASDPDISGDQDSSSLATTLDRLNGGLAGGFGLSGAADGGVLGLHPADTFGGPPSHGLAVRVRGTDALALVRALDSELATLGGALLWNGAATMEFEALAARAAAEAEQADPRRASASASSASSSEGAGGSPTVGPIEPARSAAPTTKDPRAARGGTAAEAAAQSQRLLVNDIRRLSGQPRLLDPSALLPVGAQASDFARGFSFTLVGTPSVLRETLTRLNRQAGVSVRLMSPPVPNPTPPASPPTAGRDEGDGERAHVRDGEDGDGGTTPTAGLLAEGPSSLSDLIAPEQPRTSEEWLSVVAWWRDPARHRSRAEEAGRSFVPEPVIRLPLYIDFSAEPPLRPSSGR